MKNAAKAGLLAVATTVALAVGPAPAAQASPTHTNCTGSTVKKCVSLQFKNGKVRAYSKISDRSSHGRYAVATQNTRVQYKGWDGKWHNYSYWAPDYDGWKGNYDTASKTLNKPCGGSWLRAKTTFKYRLNGTVHTSHQITSSHFSKC